MLQYIFYIPYQQSYISEIILYMELERLECNYGNSVDFANIRDTSFIIHHLRIGYR